MEISHIKDRVAEIIRDQDTSFNQVVDQIDALYRNELRKEYARGQLDEIKGDRCGRAYVDEIEVYGRCLKDIEALGIETVKKDYANWIKNHEK